MPTRVPTRDARIRVCLSAVLALCLLLTTAAVAVADSGPRTYERSGAVPFATASESASPRLHDAARRLARDGSPALNAARLAGVPAPERLEAVVLMCDFADSLMYGRWEPDSGYPEPRQYDFYYLAHDSTFFHHQMTDVAAYFQAASGGRFDFDFDVVPTVANLPHPMAWYGNHPEEGEQKVLMARDAVALLDEEVDFSAYDTVVLIHAGAGEETDILGDSPEQIYSSYLSPETFAEAVEDTILDDPWLPTDDTDPLGEPVIVDHVLVLPECEFQDSIEGAGGFYGSLGVYCFEVGLRLGMLSLSDFTPAGSPDSQGIGEFGLMGYGLFVGAGYIPAHPCAYNKLLMGWLEPYDVFPEDGDVYRLDPAEAAAGDSCLARVEINPSEYWLVEYRRQDPDGNGIFSFPGDLNGNNIPDFYDEDSVFGDGTPTSWYDPATDQREWLYGAEFDFFMSENSGHPTGAKGAGSGLYVWHVDENVIEAALLSGTNIFNADPQRKSVDLEEADGIQDLDSRLPSAWVLGGDFDSFRAEDTSVFGPDTSPSTASASGVRTGIVIDMISAVVDDSTRVVPATGDTVILYHDSMTFRCRLEDAPAGGAPERLAEVRLPGVDLRGAHLLAADLDGSGDGALEIVATAAGGRVYAFDATLAPHLPGALDPGLFAVGKGPGGVPVEWIGPAAAGDLDGDGLIEVVLAADSGLYVFNGEDGSELVDGDGDPASHGLALPLESCVAPPLVYAPGGPFADTEAAAVVERRDGTGGLRLHVWSTAGHPVQSFTGNDLQSAGPLVFWGDALWLPYRDPSGIWRLASARLGVDIVLPVAPNGRPALSTPEHLYLPVDDGGLLRVSDPDAPAATVWSGGNSVRSPLAPGPYFTGDGVFMSTGVDGWPQTGWPVEPRVPVAASDTLTAASPLVMCRGGRDETLFSSRDGRLYLYGEDGLPVDGWPVAGPGRTAGTPLLMDVDGTPGFELVAVGAADRLAGFDGDGEPAVEPVSGLTVWSLPETTASDAIWPMYGGAPARTAQPASAQTPPAGAPLLVAGSHFCYPAPLTGGELHVRAEANRDCLLRAYLYNLEGEEVRASGPVPAVGGPVEILLNVDNAVSGIYMCRLVAEGGGAREVSIRPVTIAR